MHPVARWPRSLLASLASLVVPAVLLMPPVLADGRGPRRMSDTSYACFAVQKKLLEVMEAYKQSQKPAIWEGQFEFKLHRVTAAEIDSLVAHQAPDASLADPVSTPPSKDNYVILPGGRTICLVHGSLGGTGVAQEQLVAAGVTEPALVDAALDRMPPVVWAPFKKHIVVFLLFVVFFMEALYRSRYTCDALRYVTWLAWLVFIGSIALGYKPNMRGEWVPVPPQVVTGEGQWLMSYLVPGQGDGWGVVSYLGYAGALLPVIGVVLGMSAYYFPKIRAQLGFGARGAGAAITPRPA
jgi:hypothetical protein